MRRRSSAAPHNDPNHGKGGQSQAARCHIETLERDLGWTLFLRTPSGLTPNALALSLRASVEAMEA
ncbi:hypothetical protein ACEN2J_09255 [Pseudorhodobacter sp. W20_MBD10_FR17]|uniref:hypothetical protein n=1 Tax=Pseudorhodobacter sp. W20_MBD10_FR17 TaxID=3240266 RepID=UPI003F94A948